MGVKKKRVPLDDWEEEASGADAVESSARTSTTASDRRDETTGTTSQSSTHRHDARLWNDSTCALIEADGVAHDRSSYRVMSSGSSLVPQSVVAQPQPTMRILKRPEGSPAPGSSSASQSPQVQKTIAQREAEYAAARERIFGSTPNDSSSNRIERQPAGPSGDGRGFNNSRGRGRGSKPSSQSGSRSGTASPRVDASRSASPAPPPQSS